MIRRVYKRHKYGVADKADRTHNGVVYHSRAELLALKGLRLGCWCPRGELCHADVLAVIVEEHWAKVKGGSQ